MIFISIRFSRRVYTKIICMVRFAYLGVFLYVCS